MLTIPLFSLWFMVFTGTAGFLFMVGLLKERSQTKTAVAPAYIQQ